MRRILPCLICILSACGGESPESKDIPITAAMKESLIQANKQLTLSESDEIELFIRRSGLNMDRTGTGLRYLITHHGSGEQAKTGMTATVRFTLSLLSGKVCYSSDSTGTEQFRIDHDEVESGLHEGVKLMRVGDRAKFILPSHLAHGLVGDKDCIPPRSPVVYDIELLKLN